jgi:ribosomal protein S18 acetylase RimI-like enzyme
MNVRLRPALADDAPAVAALATDAFVTAFGHIYRPEDLAAFLAEHKTAEAYRRAVTDPAHCTELAEVGGALAGFCQLHLPSEFASRSDASRPIALQQLYTDPGMTGRGVGAALMDWALARARALGCDAVQLSVYSENHGAQRFYARYGFAKTADIAFMVGAHRDAEFLFELRL